MGFFLIYKFHGDTMCPLRLDLSKSKIYHKFRAKPKKFDGLRFASKLEFDYYQNLNQLQSLGLVRFFLMQVPFHLPGSSRYVVDFQVFWSEGHVSFVDVKGVETEVFKLKKRQVEDLYPVEIEVIKKGDF